MALGKNIKRMRAQLGWTLEQLSERSGVEVGTISALEVRDSKRSQFGTAIAKAFGVSIESLESGTLLTPDMPPPDAVRPEVAAAVAAHIKPAQGAAQPQTLLTLSPAEHALIDAARPLSDADKALLEQIARRMAGEGGGPPMESRDFLPPVPSRKKDKA